MNGKGMGRKMHRIKISRAALEGARKQFCLDCCLEWQQYLENPNRRCYIQKTVYAAEDAVKDMEENLQGAAGEKCGGRYPAKAGARRYHETDAFFKAIICMGQLFLTVDSRIYDWAAEKFALCQPEWFCSYENLRMIDEKLGEYGRQISDTHVYFLPEETGMGEKISVSAEGETGAELKREWYEAEEILVWKNQNRFQRALGFSPTQPDKIAVAAMKEQGNRMVQEDMAGMAGVSGDGEYLWQIGIDIIPEFEGRGLAADLVVRLKEEVLRRGKIPFYGTSESHTVSQTVALKAGFVPAWTEIYVKPVRHQTGS